jgi:hypothetical protein
LREYESLLAEFGEPETDDVHEAMDAICEHLIGCVDPAPKWVCDEYNLPDGSTWHEVWLERVTDRLLDSPEPDEGIKELYEVYAKDLVVHPGMTPSREGFQAWLAAMLTEKDAESVMQDWTDDLVTQPS